MIGSLGEVTVMGRPECVAVLRGAAQALVALVAPEAADAAGLVCSELAGNAVRHSRSREPGQTMTLRVVDEGSTVKVEVTDPVARIRAPRSLISGTPWTRVGGDCSWYRRAPRSGVSITALMGRRRCGAVWTLSAAVTAVRDRIFRGVLRPVLARPIARVHSLLGDLAVVLRGPLDDDEAIVSHLERWVTAKHRLLAGRVDVRRCVTRGE